MPPAAQERALAPGIQPRLLDRPLPTWTRAIIILLLGIIPTLYVLGHRDPAHGFTSLILFGSKFQQRELPEVKAANPAVFTPWGYDAQFYAQIAIDPTLRHPRLARVVDNPAFRSNRYLLPLLAFVAGAGQPRAVLNIYAVLNLVFWFLLLGGLIYFRRAGTARKWLCVAALLLSTGVFISIERSLTDLPGAAWACIASLIEGPAAALFLSAAILTKPTQALLLLRYITTVPANLGVLKSRVSLIALALALPFLLQIYIVHQFGFRTQTGGNLGLPFVGLADHLATTWTTLRAIPFQVQRDLISNWEQNFDEFMAPASLAVQAFFIFRYRERSTPLWCLGAGFALLLIFLTDRTFVEQIATCRTTLPLTIAFNLRLAETSGSKFWLYFFIGNLGLWWGIHDMYVFCKTHYDP